MRNPEDYCQKCDHRWEDTDLSCQGCGFTPCDNGKGAKAYDAAMNDYSNWLAQEDGPSD